MHPNRRAGELWFVILKITAIVSPAAEVRKAEHRHSFNRMSTRRKFLLECSTVVAGLALVPARALGSGEARASNRMSYAVLARQVNTMFRVRQHGRVVELKLLKAPIAPRTPVQPGRRPPGDAGNEKFSLIFSGSKETLLASAIHRFEHDELGRFAIFISQIGAPASDSVRYEAVFNQPAPVRRRTVLT